MTPEEIPQRTAEAASAVTCLVRGVHEEPESENPLPDFLTSLSGPLWPGAIAAALRIPQDMDEHSYRVVDEAIAEALRGGARVEVVADLYNKLPRETVALRETALEVAHQMVVEMENRGLVEANAVQHMVFLNNYTGRLLQMGRIAEAQTHSRKALDFASDPAHSSLPGAARERASAMENWSHVLSQTNRTEEALAAMDMARQVLEELARERPAESKLSLAICLNNYMALLSALQRSEEAVQCGRQAAGLFRELLAGDRPSGREFAEKGLDAWIANVWPNLATCLIALSSVLDRTGRHEEALDTIAEAVSILSTLAAESAEFNPLLAQAQNNHAMALDALHRYDEELVAVSSAVTTYRELERLRPRAYTFYLAHVLRRQSLALARLGRFAEAVAPGREAAELYRELERSRPGSVRKELSGTLDQMEQILMEIGRTEEAEEFMRERAELANAPVVDAPPPAGEASPSQPE
jgi:tetratricopeptide (TPR) repeat protein